ncbi:MAG: leucine-rich repeat domain-containing protein [Clostridia bacterium]|nr:leucine-rich repeat domain-containing protein [Clostridia bacterium]
MMTDDNAYTKQPAPDPTGFVYVMNNDTLTITGYTGDSAEIVVPESIDGYPVTAIGKEAFAHRSSLVSVHLPDCITRLETGVFSGCENLQSVRLPAVVSGPFGFELFKDCTSLRSVRLPAGILGLAREIFCGCTNLEDVDVPSGPKSIGPNAFKGCHQLRNITLPKSIGTIFGNSFTDSALDQHAYIIKLCMGKQDFTLKDGQNATPDVTALKPDLNSDALAAEYVLENGFVLENSKRLLRRQEHDKANRRHVFADVMFGQEITVTVLQPKSSWPANASDEALAKYLLETDSSFGYPAGRQLVAGIKKHGDITYGTCSIREKAAFSIAVCRGHALLVYGAIASVVIHLQADKLPPQTAAASSARQDSAAQPEAPAKKPSLMEKIRRLFGN